MGREVWSYLSSHYEMSRKVGFTREGDDKSVGASVEVSGNLWDKGETTNTKVAGVNIKDSNGIRLGVFSASAGVDASLNPDALEAGVSAELTAMELYHTDVVGPDEWGVTDNADVKALSADALQDMRMGHWAQRQALITFRRREALARISLVSTSGVDATIGIKAELGIEIGKKVEVKLPFVSFGFSIGG